MPSIFDRLAVAPPARIPATTPDSSVLTAFATILAPTCQADKSMTIRIVLERLAKRESTLGPKPPSIDDKMGRAITSFDGSARMLAAADPGLRDPRTRGARPIRRLRHRLLARRDRATRPRRSRRRRHPRPHHQPGHRQAGPAGAGASHARVRVPRTPRIVSTSNDGRYEFRDIPPGRYTLRVQRSGYIALNYGQRRPGDQAGRWRSRTRRWSIRSTSRCPGWA